MSDDNMPDINRAIRKGIYSYIRANQFPETLREEVFKRKQPPEYWEEDMFDDVDRMDNNLEKDFHKKLYISDERKRLNCRFATPKID